MDRIFPLSLIVGAVLVAIAKAGDAWAAWDRKRDTWSAQ